MGKNVKTISRLDLYKRVWERPVTPTIACHVAKYQSRVEALLNEFEKARNNFVNFINPIG
jgi:hypothetical protein